MAHSYELPVAALLELGFPAEEWPDYGAGGLTDTHVDDLLRMVTDAELWAIGESDVAAGWGPVHAWRALGQLEAADAAETLVGLLSHAGDGNEWVIEELPVAIGMIGEPALAPLAATLADAEYDLDGRISASLAVQKVNQHHPELYGAVVEVLAGQLARFAENDRILNAILIVRLIELRAMESAPLMEQAFQANNVALDVTGDWEEVQIQLGLLKERITPKQHWFLAELEATGQTEEAAELLDWLAENEAAAVGFGSPARKQKDDQLRKARKAERTARKQHRKPKKKKR